MGPLNKITFNKSKEQLRKTAREQPNDPPTDPASSSAVAVERQPLGLLWIRYELCLWSSLSPS